MTSADFTHFSDRINGNRKNPDNKPGMDAKHANPDETNTAVPKHYLAMKTYAKLAPYALSLLRKSKRLYASGKNSGLYELSEAGGIITYLESYMMQNGINIPGYILDLRRESSSSRLEIEIASSNGPRLELTGQTPDEYHSSVGEIIYNYNKVLGQYGGLLGIRPNGTLYKNRK